MSLADFSRAINKYFSASELRILCFDLGIDYDGDLGDGTKQEKCIELITHFHRRGRLGELVDWIAQVRPNVAWQQVVGPIPGGQDVPDDVPAPPPVPAGEYDIAAIRRLLEAAFTAQSLRRFCLDRPVFRPAANEFGSGHGLADMVDVVIEYCDKRLLFDQLLAQVQKENPRQYERFKPYQS